MNVINITILGASVVEPLAQKIYCWCFFSFEEGMMGNDRVWLAGLLPFGVSSTWRRIDRMNAHILTTNVIATTFSITILRESSVLYFEGCF